MKFIKFIKKLKDQESINQYINKYYSNIDYYDAEVYLKNAIDVESEIIILDGEKIEGKIEMVIKNEKYYSLFSLDLLFEIYHDYSGLFVTQEKVANKIVSYRINDA